MPAGIIQKVSVLMGTTPDARKVNASTSMPKGLRAMDMCTSLNIGLGNGCKNANRTEIQQDSTTCQGHGMASQVHPESELGVYQPDHQLNLSLFACLLHVGDRH